MLDGMKQEYQADPFVAWKFIGINYDEPSLYSLYVSEPDGGRRMPYSLETEAICLQPPDFQHDECPDPEGVCQCGFNAYMDVTAAMAARNFGYLGMLNVVLTKVELYGRVVEYELGYRAQKQRIVELFVPEEQESKILALRNKLHVSVSPMSKLNLIPVSQWNYSKVYNTSDSWKQWGDSTVAILDYPVTFRAGYMHADDEDRQISSLLLSPKKDGWDVAVNYAIRYIDENSEPQIRNEQERWRHNGLRVHPEAPAEALRFIEEWEKDARDPGNVCGICLDILDVLPRNMMVCRRCQDVDFPVMKGDGESGKWLLTKHDKPYYRERHQVTFNKPGDTRIRTVLVFPNKNSWQVCATVQTAVMKKNGTLVFPTRIKRWVVKTPSPHCFIWLRAKRGKLVKEAPNFKYEGDAYEALHRAYNECVDHPNRGKVCVLCCVQRATSFSDMCYSCQKTPDLWMPPADDDDGVPF